METVFIGTYTEKDSKGIYSLIIKNSIIKNSSLIVEIDNPAYLAISKDRTKLYSVSESAHGKICQYNIYNGKCILNTFIDTNCAGLVHLAIDRKERYLFAVSYVDSNILVYRLKEDGSIGERTYRAIHIDSLENKYHQIQAHAHSVTLTPNENELCVCDLGMDRLILYNLDYVTGKLQMDPERSIEFPSGTGPRHMLFHPNGNFAYVLTELSAQIYIFSWLEISGFMLIGIVSLVEKSNYTLSAAAIRISNDGKYIYASNRGTNEIIAFSVGIDGMLEKIQNLSVMGKHPRDFILGHNEKSLLCANRDSDSITVFIRNKKNGKLYLESIYYGVSSPIALILK